LRIVEALFEANETGKCVKLESKSKTFF
jgi:hypothetical protein